MDSSDSSSPPPRHAPPHIRLNSGSGALLGEQAPQGADARSHTASRQPSARSLIPPRPGTASSLRQQVSANSLYQQTGPQESAELLVRPRRSKPSTRRFRNDDRPMLSPIQNGSNSRHTSWSSESAGSRDSRMGPFASPFDDSRAPSRAGSDDEGVNTQTVSEKYNILPSAGLLLFPEDIEKDDWLHNPSPDDKDGRMVWSDLFSSRGIANLGGLALITLGILILFIGYPVITYSQRAVNPTGNQCRHNPDCINDHTPLLQNIRHGLIDPDTPSSVKSRTAVDGTQQTLVFSDEFNQAGRTFYDADDSYFQGVDVWYGVTKDMEWYDPDAITTGNGTLNIRFDAFQNHGLNYRSGMLQSWNKLCFKGGYMEASMSLPGRGDIVGFWPGFWAMGNLGRPGYASTTEGMWPYSYDDVCDAGITKNQSDPEGISFNPGMRLPACTCQGEDHPNPGKTRSAPEIDAIEASVVTLGGPSGPSNGVASQSMQVAPFDVFWRPNTEFIEVNDRTISTINEYEGGNFQQALSTLTSLNNEWYDGNAYQKYAFEYQPGGSGYISWFIGDTQMWKLEGAALGPNGNIGQRVIPQEPMSLVVNFGMSDGFSDVKITGLAPLMPATLRIDYIRIYQDTNGEMTCDPIDYPTTDYIANHPLAYNNANVTHWAKANYTWPKNSFVDGCESVGIAT